MCASFGAHHHTHFLLFRRGSPPFQFCSVPSQKFRPVLQEVKICVLKTVARCMPVRRQNGKQNAKKPPDLNILEKSGIESRNDARELILGASKVTIGASKQDTKIIKVENKTNPYPRKESVLKACVFSSGGFCTAGLLILQASHWAADADLLVYDNTVLFPYQFETWHLGVALELVVTVSTLRQLFLRVWPAFAESSRIANQQVLGSLELSDYFIVAFLSGTSEELFFRGALLPLFGVDWRGAALSGVLFGVLHLSGGRKASFAVWYFLSLVRCMQIKKE
eukprot:c23199_g1_i1 orf=412-1251(-)